VFLFDLYEVNDVCDALYTILNFSVEQLADKISFSDFFVLGAESITMVAAIFDDLGIKSVVIFEVLSFSADYLQVCGSWCYDTLRVPMDYLGKWFIEGNFAFDDLHLFFTQTIHVGLGILLESYSLAINFCDKMIDICKGAGIAGDIAAGIFVGLKYPFIAWGYMWGFVYDLTNSDTYIRYIQTAYDTSLAGALWLLDQIGYGAQWAEGVIKAGAIFIYSTAEEIASAFKYVYDYSLEQVSVFLKDLGKSAEQLLNMAKNVYSIASEAAVKAYAEVLKGIGYAVDQIEKALNIVWDAIKSAWNWIKGLF